MLLNKKEIYKVTGMSCTSCASRVERILSKTDGIQKITVNHIDSTASIIYNKKIITPVKMNKILSEVGYGLVDHKDILEPDTEDKNSNNELRKIKNKLTGAAFLSIPVLVISFSPEMFPFAKGIMFILTTIILFYFGNEFFYNALKQAFQGHSSMDTLVALGTGAAWLLSSFNAFFPFILIHQEETSMLYFETAAIIITLMLLGKYLESKAKSHTGDSIKKLFGLQAKMATIIRYDVETEVPVEQLIVGDIVLIKPGEKVPVDGQIIEGYGLVDESMITGETFQVEKKKGDSVIGSTLNIDGRLLIEVDKVGQSTVLSQIIKLVKEAQGSRAPIQRQVDKIASVYVPIVLFLSILTALIWTVYGPETKTTFGFITAISVLLIACPCALGLATPTAILVGIGKSAEHGILIKGANSFDTIYKISAIVLDKTGTITRGKLTITDIILSNIYRNDDEDLLSVILGIEQKSEHLLATAIVEYLTLHKITPVNITDFSIITGKGVKATYKDQQYIVGTPKWLMNEGVNVPDDLYFKINELSKRNKKLVLVGFNDKATALIALRDNIKPTAYKAINDIKKLGIEIHMLSGDHEQTAMMIALETGINHFKGDVLPAEKLEYIKMLQSKGYIVAMLGDGLNDSPALAKANLSIAIGKGTDISKESADITFIKGDLSKIVSMISIANGTIKTIRQNLYWAFIYNLIGIPLAAGILFPFNGFLLNPIIAGAVMALSSVSVVTNSLRLKRIKI
jgi:P-type Cu2+ transporter